MYSKPPGAMVIAIFYVLSRAGTLLPTIQALVWRADVSGWFFGARRCAQQIHLVARASARRERRRAHGDGLGALGLASVGAGGRACRGDRRAAAYARLPGAARPQAAHCSPRLRGPAGLRGNFAGGEA